MDNDLEDLGKIIETGVDLSMRLETENNLFGPLVILRRKHFNPELEDSVEWLPAAIAVHELMTSELNGVAYKSAIIEPVYVPMWDWDQSA